MSQPRRVSWFDLIDAAFPNGMIRRSMAFYGGSMQLTARRSVMAIALVGGLAAACTGGARLQPPAQAQSFSPELVSRGAELAKVGNCTSCHTADQGAPYAGGRAVPTPFGVVYASNITPDPKTGLGRYSQAAFERALRRGVRWDGAHLYPAFPYDHFTYASDADVAALYAFLQTRRPVPAETPGNRLIPPLGFRPVLGVWKAMFFRPARFQPEPGRSAEWNRGAYLAESLGHCGSCHSPRNVLGAEQRQRAYDGGEAEGWYAPPLNAKSPAAVPWTVDRLHAYLKTGFDRDHMAAAGPMSPVVRELSLASDADVRALAVYFASLMAASPAAAGHPAPDDRAQQAAQAHPQGAALYQGACSGCHDAGAPMMVEGRPPLQWATSLQEPHPRNTVRIILDGLEPPTGRSGPYMPSFRGSFTDAQLAEVAAYLRARYSDAPAWNDLPKEVAKVRKEAAS